MCTCLHTFYHFIQTAPNYQGIEELHLGKLHSQMRSMWSASLLNSISKRARNSMLPNHRPPKQTLPAETLAVMLACSRIYRALAASCSCFSRVLRSSSRRFCSSACLACSKASAACAAAALRSASSYSYCSSTFSRSSLRYSMTRCCNVVHRPICKGSKVEPQ